MARRKKRKDRAEPFKPDPEFEERLKQAFKDFNPLEKLPEPRVTKACCPHCRLYEPIGTAN